jgi:hypothetical protein
MNWGKDWTWLWECSPALDGAAPPPAPNYIFRAIKYGRERDHPFAFRDLSISVATKLPTS